MQQVCVDQLEYAIIARGTQRVFLRQEITECTQQTHTAQSLHHTKNTRAAL